MAAARPVATPDRYAAEKLGRLLGWWSGDLGRLLREWTPRVFPGVPVEAIFGFASNGHPNEDTATSPGHAAFHEMGWAGITGGPWNVPAPNRDSSQPNDWYRLHQDPRVVGLLGRAASMADWRPLPDQTAVGLVSIADHARGIARRLDARVRPQDPASLWAIALGFMGWSAGNAGAAGHVHRYADALAAIPEGQRWEAFTRLLAEDLAAGRAAPGAARSHRNPAYSATRTLQKLAAGRLLAGRTGGQVPWFGTPDPWAEALLVRAARGEPVAGTPPPDTEASVLPGILAGAGVLGLGAWLLRWLLRRRR